MNQDRENPTDPLPLQQEKTIQIDETHCAHANTVEYCRKINYYSPRADANPGKEQEMDVTERGLPDAGIEEAVQVLRRLSARKRLRVITQALAEIEKDLAKPSRYKRRSLLGLCADLGPAPSAEIIDEARKSIWEGFPREAS